MTARARYSPAMRLLRAWLYTAATDAVFATVLSVLYGRPPERVWQGVAATPFGADMLDQGSRATLIGLGIHLSVALTWSIVLFTLVSLVPAIRRTLESPWGMVKVAALYGPCIWLMMSFVVIRTATHQPPTITYRWWIQFFAHIPFVALPMAIGLRSGRPRPAG